MGTNRTGDAVVKVCDRRGVSTSSYYEWRRRYAVEGAAGLEPRSRRPRTSPARLSAAVEERICALRIETGAGARTIRAYLKRENVGRLPAVSTIHQVLRRHGLVIDNPGNKRKKKIKRFEREHPNDMWQIDATKVELATGAVVWVIDCLDDHSRYLLAAVAAEGPTGQVAWACLEDGFAYGLPEEVLSDNGSCFTGRFLGGHEGEFERRLGELSINHIKASPGHPETIGKIERLHRTLKRWLKAQTAPQSIVELQRLLDVFRQHYG